jgi:general stress protein CsbA
MERSSRFLSLSGLSGVFIGFYALAGAAAFWLYAKSYDFPVTGYERIVTGSEAEIIQSLINFFIADALLVLILSLATGYIFTHRLAKKQGLKIWDSSAKRMLVNLLIPLGTGGAFCVLLVLHNTDRLIAPAMLVFYGLSLINASKYTHNDIRYLGIVEIVLGLAAAFFTGYGILFWAFGFGVMHIVYGIVMYFKYER